MTKDQKGSQQNGLICWKDAWSPNFRTTTKPWLPNLPGRWKRKEAEHLQNGGFLGVWTTVAAEGSHFCSLRQVCGKKSQAWRKRPLLWWLQQVFSDQPSDFAIQGGDHSRQPNDPFGRHLALEQPHFDSILVSEQELSKGAVKSFHNRLILVNIYEPASNVCFVFLHLFGDSYHDLTPRVHLQKLWPFQRLAFVNYL